MTVSIRNMISDATRLSHSRLDAMMNWGDLGQPRHYAGFLRGQAEALFPLEIAIERNGIDTILADWPQRARTPALEHDLSVLDTAYDPLPVPEFRDAAEMLGVVYVLEGFRMGGRIILSRLADQPDSSLLDATAYLRHGFGKRYWPTFLAVLENHRGPRTHPDRAVDGAQIAFAMFESTLAPAMKAIHSPRIPVFSSEANRFA